MALSSSNQRFRKVDVDQYNENNYLEVVIGSGSSSGPQESTVRNLLNSGKKEDALNHILENSIVNPNPSKQKDDIVKLALSVLSAFKMNDMVPYINKLDESLRVMLLKYVYRAFEYPQDNSSQTMLTWHEKIFDKMGYGGIVKVLNDRKRV